jgi:23S rRNA (pseudouridine1915-N3)-methyltransferase
VIRILAVGRVKDPSYAALIDAYARRIRPWADLAIAELKDRGPAREAAAMTAQLRDGEHVVALDERGAARTSRGLAGLLASHGALAFLLGGPDGLGPAARERADLTLSLSPLTLPHELARLVLVEQLYRGLAINRGHRYHRD